MLLVPPPFPPHMIMYDLPQPGTCSFVGKCCGLESYPWQLIFFENELPWVSCSLV